MNPDRVVQVSLAAAAALILAVAGVISVLGTEPEENPAWNSFLSTFSSEDQLRDFFSESDEYAAQADNGSYFDSKFSSGVTEDTSASSSDSYSRTNVQVSGVDEMDIVKTDGSCIYRSTGNGVSIIKAYPPSELANVSFIDITYFTDADEGMASFWVAGIFVADGKLVVVASLSEYSFYFWDYAWTNESGTSVPEYHPPRTVIGVFGLSDPAEPELELLVGVSGYPTAARMVDDKVYVVANSYSWAFYEDEVQIPEIWIGSLPVQMSPGKIHYDPEIQDASSFINLLAVDISSGNFDFESIVSGYASTVYMTAESLYLTFQKWVGTWSWIEDDLSTSEPDGTWTTIYRIKIDGLTMTPQAKGEVKGWLLNQFSLDEKDSYLRLATTNSWLEPRNTVYVLGPDLGAVGTLENLAPSERIYSARFLGDTLYLVTFLQIDPLFVIDLSDPFAPKVLGELEIPGFSSYLHPLDDDHLLGIGQESGKLKVSMFNVSDPTNPIEYSKYLDDASYSWSEALYDHKAVLVDIEKELLVIPVTRYTLDSEMEWWTYYESGAYVFSISKEDGVALRGYIEHGSSYDGWYGGIDRSLYIGDYLYTLSDTTIQVNDLSDLSYVDSLIYHSYDWYYPYPAGYKE